MPRITLCFLWHMHQPFYKDLWTGEYKLPWTRLHALKDYYGMVKMLEEFPAVHQTFNLVPSMMVQIDEYANGVAVDPFLQVALKPAEDLTEGEVHFALTYLFQANYGRLILRYPRYAELYEWRHDRSRFDAQALRDLQVLSQIAWIDEDDLSGDPFVRGLIEKGRSFSLKEQEALGVWQRKAISRVLPVYKEFASKGQIEVSTTPFYHPILPLICDSDIASISHPGVTLPTRFRYPEDAREQLERAVAYMDQNFGIRPSGLWPSEGSVSDEALSLAAESGFRWAATDNGVLARTLQADGSPARTYKAYQWEKGGKSMSLLFRDHFLSDLIGFSYSGVEANAAADHFLHQIRENCRPLMEAGETPLVPIILDGENAWEHFEQNGRPFLRALYSRIAASEDLQALTVSEALESHAADPLTSIAPGSWINANFDVWIGAEEDNEAWEHLRAAREVYAQKQSLVGDQARGLAYEELLISEGSDWNWWYGPEHHSENQVEFDELYRGHLTNVYRALGQEPPPELAIPILRSRQAQNHDAPTAPVTPSIDGEVTTAYEWLGAGRYRPDPRMGAMHGGEPLPVREIFYGFHDGRISVRVDFNGPPAGLDLRMEVGSSAVEGTWSTNGFLVKESTGDITCAFRNVLEVQTTSNADAGALRMRFSRGELPVGIVEVPVEYPS
ncbi:MAG: glycoside hydrolase family 57 protein [Bryobacteraceae bacterium]